MSTTTIERLQDEVIKAVQLGDYPRARQLIADQAAVADKVREYKDLLDQQTAAREDLEKKIEALKDPPLTRAIVLGRSPDAEQQVIIGTGGQRMEVCFLGEGGTAGGDLVPGSEAWLNEDRRIVKVRAPTNSGEAGLVTAILDDGRLEVKGRGSDELIIEPVAGLRDTLMEVGDRVRFDSQLAVALERLPPPSAKELELESVPDVTYDDIGGLDQHIEQIREAIELPYLYNALFRRYRLRRPKGILLYGPPGCGKTMIAKAIANNLTREIKKNLKDMVLALRCLEAMGAREDGDPQWQKLYLAWKYRNQAAEASGEPDADPTDELPEAEVAAGELTGFLDARGVARDADPGALAAEMEAQVEAGSKAYFMSIKGPELLNKYVGETEHSIRKLFIQAKRHATSATPVIMFFDEIEALFRRRGSRSTSDMESTVVPQFLSEIDGVEELKDVIIIGATNRQDLLDPAILRPGRLDAKIRVDRPNRSAAQAIFGKYLSDDLPVLAGSPDEPAQASQVIDDMITRAVELLFHPGSILRVSGRPIGNETKSFLWREFISGAMIESTVSRAKKAALKREIDTGAGGLCWDILKDAIVEEVDQNKDQLVAGQLNLPEEDLTISLILPEGEAGNAAGLWLTPIERPWRSAA